MCGNSYIHFSGSMLQEERKAGTSVQGKLQLAGMHAMFAIWIRWVGFGVTSREDARLEGKK